VARFLDLGHAFAALLFASENRLMMRSGCHSLHPRGLLAVLLTAFPRRFFCISGCPSG